MILKPTAENIQHAVEVLRNAGCIGLPTETVYGLAADGLNPNAALKIFEIKERPKFDPLILHVPIGYDLSQLITHLPVYARDLIQRFWPGPLTFVLHKTKNVPDLITSGLDTVAVRCPSHSVAQEILSKVGKPLAAPSANKFGRISPTTAIAVEEELGDLIPLIIDGGPCTIGVESTILDCSGERPQLLRPGAISLEELTDVVGKVEREIPQAVVAPGLLKNHYAPRKPLYCSFDPLKNSKVLPKASAFLFWSEPHPSASIYKCLSPMGNLREAAQHLFEFLRILDQSTAQRIFVDPIPNFGLGFAIQDRLIRASSGFATIQSDGSFVIQDK